LLYSYLVIIHLVVQVSDFRVQLLSLDAHILELDLGLLRPLCELIALSQGILVLFLKGLHLATLVVYVCFFVDILRLQKVVILLNYIVVQNHFVEAGHDFVSLHTDLAKLDLLERELVLELCDICEVINFVDEGEKVQNFLHVLLCVGSEGIDSFQSCRFYFLFLVFCFK
jgi:hypothetical protein